MPTKLNLAGVLFRLWAIFAVLYWMSVIYQMHFGHPRYDPPSLTELVVAYTLPVLVYAGIWMLVRVCRWVFRGFRAVDDEDG